MSVTPPVVMVTQEIRSCDQPLSQRCAALEYQDQQVTAARIRISPPRRSKGLPARVKSIVAVMQPQIARILAHEGTETSGSTSPEDFNAFLAEDAKLWARLVKESGAKAD